MTERDLPGAWGVRWRPDEEPQTQQCFTAGSKFGSLARRTVAPMIRFGSPRPEAAREGESIGTEGGSAVRPPLLPGGLRRHRRLILSHETPPGTVSRTAVVNPAGGRFTWVNDRDRGTSSKGKIVAQRGRPASPWVDQDERHKPRPIFRRAREERRRHRPDVVSETLDGSHFAASARTTSAGNSNSLPSRAR